MSQLKQISFDFEKITHVRENTSQNEVHLNRNRFHFTGQCLVVLTWLQKGLFVTGDFAYQNRISRLPSRISDLGEYGELDIDREYALGSDGKPTRFLAYFFPENRQRFIEEKRIVNGKRWWYSDKYTPREIIEQIKNG